MATQQLPTSLPPGWESDYDGTSERWFFIHRPTGFTQYFFPKAGDEETRIAELAQPQPMSQQNGSLTIKMEAMTISENTTATTSNLQTAPSQQPSQPVPQAQPISTPQPAQSPHLQQGVQGSPIARTMSQSVQRKSIPRRDSVQSQVSTRSAQSIQSAAQPTQQFQQGFNPQSATQTVQNVQPTQQAPQYQQPAQLQQVGQQGQPIQYSQQMPQYVSNQQPVQAQQPQQPQQAVPQFQNQQPQQYQQIFVNGHIQYQPIQPVQPNVYTSQSQVPQSPVHSPQSYGSINQAPQQLVQPQQVPNQMQHPQMQQPQMQQPQMQQPQIQQTQMYQNAQVQPQYTTATPQATMNQQTGINGQRRFSTIPVLHQPNTGQVSTSPPPTQQQQFQGTRHSSIPLNSFQPRPLVHQGQQVQAPQGHPAQSAQVPLTYAPQVTQPINTQAQQPPVQQHIATTPAHLPPPAPGMQWVLVQPGTPSSGSQPPMQPAQSGQQAIDPNKSPNFSTQMQQFGGAAAVGPARPGLVNRMSSGSRKAFESSKGFVKKNPGKTMAIVGGLGLVAEACGVSVISDAVAGSKVYANVQAAKTRKKLANAAQTPTTQQPQVVNQAANPGQVGNANAVDRAPHAHVPQQHPQVMQQQQHATHTPNTTHGAPMNHSVGHGGVVHPQQTFTPQMPAQQHVYHLPPHQQFVHHHPHQQQADQQFDTQQNAPQSTDPSAQFAQAQNSQPQYFTQNGQPVDPSSQFVQNQNSQPQYFAQQNPPVQYYQPVDNSQQQFQQQNSSPVYAIQDGSGQNNQQGSGNLLNYTGDAYNMLPNGQGNPSSQPQSPTPDSQFSQQQQQLPTPTTSPFDASSQQFTVPSPTSFDPSSQQQQQIPDPATSPFDPSQVQQLSTSTPPPFDPSTQFPQQQGLQDQASIILADQSIANSQQFTNDLLGQSVLNASIQDDNSYINPPSPTLTDTGSDYGQGLAYDDIAAEQEADSLALAEDDMDSAIF